MVLSTQIIWLIILAIPIACITWTVTHEEVFKEPRQYCIKRCQESKTFAGRKFFYLFTCEYCFSHYITIIFLFITKYQLLLNGWRGYFIAGFALVFVANVYMGLFALIRLDMKHIRLENESGEKRRRSSSSNDTLINTLKNK